MTLTIWDDSITSDQTAHTARPVANQEYRWEVSWLALLRSEAFPSMPQPHAVLEEVNSSQEPGIPPALGRGKRPKALAPFRQLAVDLVMPVEPLACRACHTGHYRA
jgi:hypothetical protein